VKARFTVGEDGKAGEVVHEGHPMLAAAVTMAISKTQFASHCAGNLEVVYNFVLEGAPVLEPRSVVNFTAPGEYTITSNPRDVNCIIYGTSRKSWLRRLLHF
jgi:hypothetical protein